MGVFGIVVSIVLGAAVFGLVVAVVIGGIVRTTREILDELGGVWSDFDGDC